MQHHTAALVLNELQLQPPLSHSPSAFTLMPGSGHEFSLSTFGLLELSC